MWDLRNSPIFVDAEPATFDGQSRITYDISGEGQFVQTWEDHLRMRFRTNHANGLLFFADGNQGDYLIMELVRGELFLHLDLGMYLSSALFIYMLHFVSKMGIQIVSFW